MASGVDLSIPYATVSTTKNPYTVYNVSIRLPLRSFVSQKRYSDFVNLNKALTSQAGSAPPASLPPKSWFTRTVTSSDLTEDRRQGLEKYLKSINENADRKWRETSAWRTFLDLPASGPIAGGRDTTKGLRSGFAGAPVTDPSVWLDTHRDLKNQLHDARLHLQRRDQAESTQGQHESSASAKKCLVRVGGMIASLDQGLQVMGNDENNGHKLGDGERRRRKDLVSNARKEKEGLEALAHSAGFQSRSTDQSNSTKSSSASQDQSALFAADHNGDARRARSGRGGRVLGAPVPETEQTRELDNKGVLQLQKQLMEDQDMSVEQLQKGVSRLKELGVAINEELLVQADMLKMTEEDTDRLGDKISVAKKRVNKIS